MEPPNGHPCPECGAPRRPDKTPSCTCTHRVAEALRDTRTAQAAAAEDFDPLHIRPYVGLDTATGTSGSERPTRDSAAKAVPRRPADGDSAVSPDEETWGPGHPGRSAEDATRAGCANSPSTPSPAQGPAPSRSVSSRATPSPGPTSHGTRPGRAAEGGPRRTPAGGPAAPSHAEYPRTDTSAGAAEGAAPPPSTADATMPLRPVDPDATTVLPVSPGTALLPTPPASATTELSVTDLRLFDGAGVPQEDLREAAGAGGRPRRRRRTVLLAAAAGGCVAAVAAAGYATGLFSYEAPSRDTALPEGTRASVPDAPSSSAASTPPTGSAPVTQPAPAAPPPSPTATRSPSASPSPSTPSASPSPSRSATPSAPQTSAPATGPGQAPPDNSRQNGGPTTLRLGDTGPEVSELQLRLRQLLLFNEDADGTFDNRLEEAVRAYQWSRGVQGDDLGVYDRETRAKLESETKEP